VRARAGLGLHRFEGQTLAGLAVAVVVLRFRGFAPDWGSAVYIAKVVGERLPSLLLVGLLCQLVAAAARRDLRGFLRVAFSRAGLLLLARAWLALAAVTYAYTFVKVSAPILNSRLFDAQLEALDRILHFGLAPTVFAVELVKGTLLAPLLDVYYMLWLTTTLVFQSATFWSVSFPRRKNFLLACGLLWLSGSWIYVAVPAVGPCYATPEVYAPIREAIPNATALQASLLRNYRAVLASRDGTRREIRPLLAVAAMPSLHVGAHFLCALWTWRHARRLFLPCALATGLTFFGSLVTGWHYAVDGYAGLLLAWAAVALADRWEPVPVAVPPAAEPARATEVGQQPS
jgi:hypothetical protein